MQLAVEKNLFDHPRGHWNMFHIWNHNVTTKEYEYGKVVTWCVYAVADIRFLKFFFHKASKNERGELKYICDFPCFSNPYVGCAFLMAGAFYFEYFAR